MNLLANLWNKVGWDLEPNKVYHNKRNIKRSGIKHSGTITECFFVNKKKEMYTCSFMLKETGEVEVRIKSDPRKLDTQDPFDFIEDIYSPHGHNLSELRRMFKNYPKPPTYGYNPSSRKSIIFKSSELDFRKKQSHLHHKAVGQGDRDNDIKLFFYFCQREVT